jgi:hypothetical protein
MRTKLGRVVLSVIVGLIAFVFVFYGVFNPRALRGLHSGSIAGSVNGEPISVQEYSSQYRSMLNMFKSYGDGQVSDEMIKNMGLKKMAFDGIVRKKVLFQLAQKQGLMPSRQEIADSIAQYEVFQKNNVFDYMTYQNLLAANKLSPHRFEKTVAEELAAQTWEKTFDEVVLASEAEVKKDWMIKNRTVKIEYISVPVVGQLYVKDLATPSEDSIAKFLADAKNNPDIEKRFEQEKEGLFKGMDFEKSKKIIGQLLLQEQDKEKLHKRIMDAIADNFSKTDKKSREKLTQVLALAKLNISEKEGVHLLTPSLKEIYSPEMVLRDIFSAANLTLGEVKTYEMTDQTVKLRVLAQKEPQGEQFDKQKSSLVAQFQSQKAHKVYQAWVDDALKAAKIESNPDVLAE